MKMIPLILITLILIALSAIFIWATLMTWKTQTSPRQKVFLSGTVPGQLPEGLYKGKVPGHEFSWQGKKFSSKGRSASGRNKDGTGINVFKNGDQITDKYPFKYYEAKGLQDNKQVIRINYRLPENPLWLRFIVDEIVETSSNKYLGKLHIKLIPGLVASLGYFTLEK